VPEQEKGKEFEKKQGRPTSKPFSISLSHLSAAPLFFSLRRRRCGRRRCSVPTPGAKAGQLGAAAGAGRRGV